MNIIKRGIASSRILYDNSDRVKREMIRLKRGYLTICAIVRRFKKIYLLTIIIIFFKDNETFTADII